MIYFYSLLQFTLVSETISTDQESTDASGKHPHSDVNVPAILASDQSSLRVDSSEHITSATPEVVESDDYSSTRLVKSRLLMTENCLILLLHPPPQI